MNAIQRDYCAKLVEEIRQIVMRAASADRAGKPRRIDWNDDVYERCDQLVMRLQPIEIIRPKEHR